ncbi:hypothetical protein, partial [Rhodopirellula sallentina]|uniref:hypothetical protein n=1 Tax=Rhodopirellula sallentina TaxID=1263869 RepID=UPI001F4469E6
GWLFLELAAKAWNPTIVWMPERRFAWSGLRGRCEIDGHELASVRSHRLPGREPRLTPIG